MDGLRNWLSRRVFSPLQGVTFGSWRRVRREYGLHPERPYLLRAALTELLALVNSVQARRERRRFGDAVAQATAPDPVFVLGHYRSGTTLLHTLLALDPRLSFPNYYQCSFPESFLVTQRTGTSLFGGLSPRKRPHDDVRIGLRAPAEDELALCAMVFLSPHMGWHFPRRSREFERFVTFENATEEQRRAFRDALATFVRKLAVGAPDRPAVLKSPCHTGRVDLLLETFPRARFVHIHRHPFEVFRSTRHMERKVRPLFRYQNGDDEDPDGFILRRYRRMVEAYLRHRRHVPDGRACELSFHELTADPVRSLRRVYDRLGLPAFDGEAVERVERYLREIAGYRRNRHAGLDDDTRRRVARAWAPFFERWSYRTDERRARSA
jgi:hypothetical protein